MKIRPLSNTLLQLMVQIHITQAEQSWYEYRFMDSGSSDDTNSIRSMRQKYCHQRIGLAETTLSKTLQNKWLILILMLRANWVQLLAQKGLAKQGFHTYILPSVFGTFDKVLMSSKLIFCEQFGQLCVDLFLVH